MPATAAPSSAKPIEIPLHQGYRGYVSGLVKAATAQRAFIQVFRQGVEIASATFEGKGENGHLKNVMDDREHWSFGPLRFPATMRVTIYNDNGGKNVPSKTVGPFELHKKPEPGYFPMEFYQTTIISEDGNDQDYNDCTVAVLQYK